MKYEVLEQLRNAGFPQKDGDIYRIAFDAPKDIPPYKWAYFPTLEELIEACPNMYDLRRTAPSRGSIKPRWIAEAWAYQMDNTSSPVQKIGSTPSEAVANLWLALNKKEV